GAALSPRVVYHQEQRDRQNGGVDLVDEIEAARLKQTIIEELTEPVHFLERLARHGERELVVIKESAFFGDIASAGKVVPEIAEIAPIGGQGDEDQNRSDGETHPRIGRQQLKCKSRHGASPELELLEGLTKLYAAIRPAAPLAALCYT